MDTKRRLTVACAAVATMLIATILAAQPASAAQQFQIAFTGIGIYPRSEPTMAASKRVGAAVPDGTTINVVCETEGEAVSNGMATISIWMKTDAGTFFPNAYVFTGYDGRTPGIPDCRESPVPKVSSEYNRDAAVAWAIENVDTRPSYEQDCTFFVSQALWAGGIAPTPDWEPSSQFSSETRAALVADDFKNYLRRAGIVDQVREVTGTRGTMVPGAQLGDVIGYDWNHDGVLDHLAIVTSTVGDATLVTAHTNPRLHAPWDLGQGSYNGVRYYLLHIVH